MYVIDEDLVFEHPVGGVTDVENNDYGSLFVYSTVGNSISVIFQNFVFVQKRAPVFETYMIRMNLHLNNDRKTYIRVRNVYNSDELE